MELYEKYLNERKNFSSKTASKILKFIDYLEEEATQTAYKYNTMDVSNFMKQMKNFFDNKMEERIIQKSMEL